MAQHTFDKLSELRSYTATALSASQAGAGTPVAMKFDTEPLVRYVINVAAHTGYLESTNYWTINLTLDSDSNPYSGGYTLKTFVPVGAVIQYAGNIACDDLELLGYKGRTYITVDAVKTGTPGTLTYGAYLTLRPAD